MANALAMYRGEHKIWTLALAEAGVAVDLTGAALRFVVRERAPRAEVLADTDATLLLTSAPAAGLTITDAEGGELELELVKARTNALNGTSYVWELALLPNGATEYVVAVQGTLTITPDIGRGD